MTRQHPRIAREKKTVRAMIRLYCRSYHGTRRELCAECAELAEYAAAHLDKCPFQQNKTTCNKCPVHCYRPGMRERIREVMRFAGPRMVYRHPILALFHLLDGRRREPVRPVQRAS